LAAGLVEHGIGPATSGPRGSITKPGAQDAHAHEL
jgi:hypothetical protein